MTQTQWSAAAERLAAWEDSRGYLQRIADELIGAGFPAIICEVRRQGGVLHISLKSFCTDVSFVFSREVNSMRDGIFYYGAFKIPVEFGHISNDPKIIANTILEKINELFFPKI